MGEGEFELHRWFSESELELCPICGEAAAVNLPGSGSLVCFACGYLRSTNPETHGSAEAVEG